MYRETETTIGCIVCLRLLMGLMDEIDSLMGIMGAIERLCERRQEGENVE